MTPFEWPDLGPVFKDISRIRPFPLSPTIFFLELLSCLARQQHTPELNLPPRRDSKWKIR
jgi:hypothetical protein